MNYETVAILIAALSGLAALGFWIWLVAVPVARSFTGKRDRTLAVIASLYTLIAALAIGAGAAAAVVYNWDRIAA